MDFRVFIDCDEDTRFMRRLARDTDPHGAGGRGRSATSVYRTWADVVKPAHHQFVEPTRRFANIVVPSTRVHASPRHLKVVTKEARSEEGGVPTEEASEQPTPTQIGDEEEEMLPALHLMALYLINRRDCLVANSSPG
jgi:hypothetical protein